MAHEGSTLGRVVPHMPTKLGVCVLCEGEKTNRRRHPEALTPAFDRHPQPPPLPSGLGLRSRFGRKAPIEESETTPTAPAADKLFTWEEVAEHNSAKSVWVTVRGKVYDITGFLDSHPGGKEILLLAAGRDITYAFDSYHPFTDKPQQGA